MNPASKSIGNGQPSTIKITISRDKLQSSTLRTCPSNDKDVAEVDEPMETVSESQQELKRLDKANQRHEADLLEHHYEAPKAERVQDEYVYG